MKDRKINASDIKGHVHAAIITIRQDEYDAVESRLSGSIPCEGGNNSYEVITLNPNEGGPILVALTRCVGQGNLSAHSVASNILHDLDPAWLLLVGIAGGVAANEYCLGDVILATELHDFSFGAATADGQRTYHSGGGSMHPEVVRFLQTKIGGKNRSGLMDLAGFATREELKNCPPLINDDSDLSTCLYGDLNFQKEVGQMISRRFPGGFREDGVRVWSGPCANGNLLVKDPTLMSTWQKYARQVNHVETELAGVYAAAHSGGRQNYPVFAIRALSDIVGLKRNPDWTQYACNSAAAFTYAILQSGFIDFSKNLPTPL